MKNAFFLARISLFALRNVALGLLVPVLSDADQKDPLGTGHPSPSNSSHLGALRHACTRNPCCSMRHIVVTVLTVLEERDSGRALTVASRRTLRPLQRRAQVCNGQSGKYLGLRHYAIFLRKRSVLIRYKAPLS